MRLDVCCRRAVAYAPRGIRINAVCPGTIDTPMVADMLEGQAEAMVEIMKEQSIGRLAEPRRSLPLSCGYAARERASWSASVCRLTAASPRTENRIHDMPHGCRCCPKCADHRWRACLHAEISVGHKRKRDAIHAITKASWFRAVVKNVSIAGSEAASRQEVNRGP